LSDAEAVLRASDEELISVLRPTGHYLSKPRKLGELARFVVEAGGVEALRRAGESTEELRSRLLSLWGIGPETADAILLYALGRPIFVADGYALRLTSRWGLLSPDATYAQIQRLFMDNLPHDAALFNEYHALIVAHGKALCKTRPLCTVCPLNQPITIRVQPSETWSYPRLHIPS
jgi:endonuclease-3 related protein